jgi:hypothetical protein
MVALANKIGADPWFNMPHLATDEYVEEFATIVRDTLNSGLVAHVEPFNEIWNDQFSHTWWARDEARRLWGEVDVNDNINWQAMRSAQMLTIWKNVFGVEASTRLRTIIGIQSGSGYTMYERILNTYVWYNRTQANIAVPGTYPNNPEPYIELRDVLDGVAETSYWGGIWVGNPSNRAVLADYLSTHTFDQTGQWLKEQMLDPEGSDNIPSVAQLWSITQAYLDAEDGIGHYLYEGGHHILLPGVTASVEVVAFLYWFIRSQYCADVYEASWDAWAAIGDGPYMQFTDVSPASLTPGNYGFFGLLEDLFDSSPRSELLARLNAEAEAWGGMTGGEHYLPQVTIAGEGGRHEISARGGKAFGISGKNVVQLPGERADYTITYDDEGRYLFTHTGGAVSRLTSIDTAAFVG